MNGSGLFTFSGLACSFSNLSMSSGLITMLASPDFSFSEYGILYRCLLAISTVSIASTLNGLNFPLFANSLGSFPIFLATILIGSFCNILGPNGSRIISCKYAAIFLGPSGKRSFTGVLCTVSGNDSKGIPMWNPWFPENLIAGITP